MMSLTMFMDLNAIIAGIYKDYGANNRHRHCLINSFLIIKKIRTCGL